MANTAALLRAQELWKPASRLPLVRDEPVFLPLEVPALKRLWKKGLTRGGIAEVYGNRSSGRTSVYLHILAQVTARGEVCAVVDLHNSFHPGSAATVGVRLEQLLWVRCQGNAEHAMHAADLLLHAGGFGAVVLDLCEASARVLNRIPLSYWYRFRRAIENTPAILVVCSGIQQVKSSANSSLWLKRKALHWSGQAPFYLLRSLEFTAALRTPRAVSPPLSIRAVT
ncbi:MAG: hypothetical protein JOY62_02415 [Acidobacteriaceae bacterium]|nr:hypothetical protein [Acidobacteriaceae bacterium]MBV9778803.1 hypothetical protein [Acidobacteriaceae bacterium]